MSVVRWVPLYRADLSLPVEPRDLVRVLRRNVAPAWPSMPFWSSREPYFGEVSGDSFLVRPVGVAVSALRPVIVGTIAAREGGSPVTFTSRPSWFATFAMIATVTLFLVFDGALVVQEWNAGRPLRIAMLLPHGPELKETHGPLHPGPHIGQHPIGRRTGQVRRSRRAPAREHLTGPSTIGRWAAGPGCGAPGPEVAGNSRRGPADTGGGH
jgi:hypothetical protein